jgi:G:T-mismatch repair DNA endonuclease (very short patch repair protein)
MITYRSIIKAIRKVIPEAERTPSVQLTINEHWTIKIARPSSFDSYRDIEACVTLLYDKQIVWEVLLTQDTDLNKFCNKLSQKIKEYNYAT